MKLAEGKHLTNNRSSVQPRRSVLSVKAFFLTIVTNIVPSVA